MERPWVGKVLQTFTNWHHAWNKQAIFATVDRIKGGSH